MAMGALAFLQTSPSAWSATAAWVAVALGVVAAVYAARQAREARILRKEQARPYVVVYTDSSPAGWTWIDLVIKNFGRTAATNVQVSVEPKPQRAAGRDPDVSIPEAIPVLVPGQEWRTFWDGTHVRDGSGLPPRHRATVAFQNSLGERFSDAFDLDFGATYERTMITVYGEHDAAKALHDIRDTLASWKESGGGQGLRIFSRNGDTRDKRDADEWEKRRAEDEAER
jgi:hypothetical protein